jgi:hypothetical protein
MSQYLQERRDFHIYIPQYYYSYLVLFIINNPILRLSIYLTTQQPTGQLQRQDEDMTQHACTNTSKPTTHPETKQHNSHTSDKHKCSLTPDKASYCIQETCKIKPHYGKNLRYK